MEINTKKKDIQDQNNKRLSIVQHVCHKGIQWGFNAIIIEENRRE